MDPFDLVRNERDPLRQARQAGELITTYQQRSAELARIRKEAINRLAQERSLTFTEVARLLDLSKGRITQIRQNAPARERVFFGVGPVTVAVPEREMPGRPLPMVATEDLRARNLLSAFLEQMSFVVVEYGIPPSGLWKPHGDVVAICGPKSSPVTAEAIESDPVLSFSPDSQGRWAIRDRRTGTTYQSPMDGQDPDHTRDMAYFGRLALGDERPIIIAGVHALGSVGAVHYLINHFEELYAQVGTKRFSMVIESVHSKDTVVSSKAVVTPCLHE